MSETRIFEQPRITVKGQAQIGTGNIPLKRFGLGPSGVDNAARTRDLLNHNQMLYRLSYIHHGA